MLLTVPRPLAQVLSKGKVLDFNSQKFIASVDRKHTLSFRVTPAMVPSIRLLVYYILYGEGISELVADSIWLDVRDNCVNGLQVQLLPVSLGPARLNERSGAGLHYD